MKRPFTRVRNSERSTSGLNNCPIAFNLAIDWIMQNALRQGMHGISLDDTYVPNLDFADDICLLEDNAEDAQHLLDSVVYAA